jgi:hypothetical protein
MNASLNPQHNPPGKQYHDLKFTDGKPRMNEAGPLICSHTRAHMCWTYDLHEAIPPQPATGVVGELKQPSLSQILT